MILKDPRRKRNERDGKKEILNNIEDEVAVSEKKLVQKIIAIKC